MGRRAKLTESQVNEIKAMLGKGVKGDAVARAFGISNTHVYRIKSAMRTGVVNLKPTSLNSCMNRIATGLPFRRIHWPEKLYYYYDKNDQWFIQVNTETGCELIIYTLDLKLEDLLARDWVVLTWESLR